MKTSILLLSTFLSVSVFADASVERIFRFGGFFGQGAFERTEKDSFNGLNKKSDYQKKFTGAILGKIGPKSDQTIIIQLPQDKIYNLDNRKKKYTVSKISPENVNKAQNEGESTSSPQESNSKNTVKIVKNKLDVKNTGEKKTINGYHCIHYILTWNLVTENTADGTVNDYLMPTDLWNTPANGMINNLVRAESRFNSAYLKKLNMDVSPDEQKQLGLSVLSGISGNTQQQVKRKMAQISGYPIVTEVKWEHSQTIRESSGSTLNSPEDMIGGLLKKAKQKTVSKGQRREVFSSYTEIQKISSESESATVPDDYKLAN